MEELTEEKEWRSIPSLNNRYEVTPYGQIRNAKTKRILHQYLNIHGYFALQVKIAPNKKKNISVHRVVAEVFIGRCPEGYVVNHKDGNKQNNHVSNLEYVTPSQNNQHALDNGLRHPANMKKYSPKGEQHYRAKITKEIVYEILKIRDETGYGCRRIAKILGISYGTVDAILRGKTWKKEVEQYYINKGENENE